VKGGLVPARLSRPPVFYVLTQAQFSPVKNIASYINEVQDQMRLNQYPEYQEELGLRLQPAIQGPQIEKVKQWHMSARDKKSGFIINDSSIVFHTTDYSTHDSFLPEILKGLNILQSIVKLDSINRLGLRYLNLILPEANENLGEYLDSKLINMAFKGQHQYTKTETIVRTELNQSKQSATLIFRAHVLHGKPSIPNDIGFGPLVPRKEFFPDSPPP